MPTATAVPDAARRLYKATRKPELIDVPELGFLMIDGTGDPATAPAYWEAIEALYSLSYRLRFALRDAVGLEYRVGPLEGLWWADDMRTFEAGDRSDWHWTAMIVQPDAVTAALVDDARAQAARRRRLPGLDRARLERYREGPSAQVLHVGPYADEGRTIAVLHAFIRERGLDFDGRVQRHHEIYLGDPRRTAPERLRTIVRQPLAGG